MACADDDSRIDSLYFQLTERPKQAAEFDAVAKAVNDYLVGETKNDFSTLEKAFHTNATMKYFGTDGYHRYRRKCRIRQTRFVYKGMTLCDYMHLLKIDGSWKIVCKIFSRNPAKQSLFTH